MAMKGGTASNNCQMDLHKENVDEIVWPSPDAPGAVEAVFVRHGETDNNKNRIIQGGNLNSPLNDTGRKQAADQAKKLKKESFDVIVASPLKRAMETATIIAEELCLEID